MLISELTLFILSIGFVMAIPAMVKNQVSDGDSSASDDIKSVYDQMSKAAQAKDAETVSQCFAEDVFFKLPGQPPVTSRDGVEKLHEGMFRQGMGVKFSTNELKVYDDVAVEVGTAELITPDGNVASEMIYLTNWKHINGSWKIYRDVVSAMPEEG